MYPNPAVQTFINQLLVPVRLILNRREDQPNFRAHRVIWTPTLAILDRRGVSHYQSPGYLPPQAFLHLLHVGLARAHLAWAGYDQATALLQTVIDTPDSLFAPEALYWQGVAWYLQQRRRAPMMVAWNRLRHDYPASPWAARIPPNQEEGDEP